MSILRYREDTDDGPIIHAGPSDGNDVTLCGYALEGEADTRGGGKEPVKVNRGRINCPNCVNIILVCKSIPTRCYDPEAAKQFQH